MNKSLCIVAALLSCAAHAGPPGPPPPGGGRYAAPPGGWGGGYRPVYPGVRPVYPAWRPAYWGPRAGVYVAGPGYWGAWPYAWGAAYAVPYPVTPWVVAANPAPQVIVQQPVVTEAPASSYWYYCAQPAGYYPYVQNCNQPWMKVVPQVPGSNGAAPQLAP